MNSQKILDTFTETKALLKGHFELSSGRHSDTYFQCALVLQYPDITEKLAAELAKKLKNDDITCVIGPALGGVTIAYELGRQLKCRALFAERKEGVMQLRRGFSLSPEDKVLLVEDVITTGGSVLEVAELVKQMKVAIAGICCVVNRSNSDMLSSYQLTSLVKMTPQLFEPDACPLCKQGIPLSKPGSKKIIGK
ncbi:MAG: orotate phosphoribosyltransferase [Candidatus Omnitrophica bacterium]|nr:orotate phosphoribosyltransferase [Candidatus Omnitrophota bacterium]